MAAETIADTLPELVFEVLTPVYELFDLFVLARELVEAELREMRRNRFLAVCRCARLSISSYAAASAPSEGRDAKKRSD